MTSTVNSELYNATLLKAKSENKVGRLQLASFAGCKTKFMSKYLMQCWPDFSSAFSIFVQRL